MSAFKKLFVITGTMQLDHNMYMGRMIFNDTIRLMIGLFYMLSNGIYASKLNSCTLYVIQSRLHLLRNF